MSRPLGQKISIAFAILCYIAAAGCAVGAALYDGGRPNDPIQASLMASVIFFVGAGIVLQVIGTARLKGIVTLPKADAGSSENRAP